NNRDPAHERPTRGNRHDHLPMRAPARTPERGRYRAHAAFSMFQSDWIALRPSYSQLIPYCGRFTLLMLALAIQAGEPGTVEKTEFWRVVTLPSGPRYGSIAVSTRSGTCRVPLPPATSWLIGTNSTPLTSPIRASQRSPS